MNNLKHNFHPIYAQTNNIFLGDYMMGILKRTKKHNQDTPEVAAGV